MKTAVIVQTRMTSNRLPGKVMLPLGDKTVLGEVLSRCAKIEGIDVVCCAIPVGAVHDLLIPEATKYGAVIFRGSELDVLARYYEAAASLKATTIMRITSDCPLIDPKVCQTVLSTYFKTHSEFTCNNNPPTWPHGYDCEVFSFDALKRAHLNATLPEEREHVTPWIREHFNITNVPNPNGNHYHIRITLDTKEDYINIVDLFKKGKITNESIQHEP